jgi:hypothetical protein
MVDDRVTGSMRFSLAADRTLPSGRAREVAMELDPWTFRAAAAELERWDLIDRDGGPASPGLGDPRDYLYLEVALGRDAPAGPPTGVAIGVRLAGDPRVYRSDHGLPERALTRSGALATAVKLPPGRDGRDVVEVLAIRSGPPGGDRVTVEAVHRAFFLDPAFRPTRSFIHGTPRVDITRARPWAMIWSRSGREPAAPPDCSRHIRPAARRRVGDAV